MGPCRQTYKAMDWSTVHTPVYTVQVRYSMQIPTFLCSAVGLFPAHASLLPTRITALHPPNLASHIPSAHNPSPSLTGVRAAHATAAISA